MALLTLPLTMIKSELKMHAAVPSYWNVFLLALSRTSFVVDPINWNYPFPSVTIFPSMTTFAGQIIISNQTLYIHEQSHNDRKIETITPARYGPGPLCSSERENVRRLHPGRIHSPAC